MTPARVNPQARTLYVRRPHDLIQRSPEVGFRRSLDPAVGAAVKDYLFYGMVALTPSMVFMAMLLWRDRSHEHDARDQITDYDVRSLALKRPLHDVPKKPQPARDADKFQMSDGGDVASDVSTSRAVGRGISKQICRGPGLNASDDRLRRGCR